MRSFEEIMNDPLTSDEQEAMSHGYYASRVFEGNDGRTFVSWTFGLSCALPKADIIVFVIPSKSWTEAGIACPDEPPANAFIAIQVRWKTVVRLLGKRWERRFNRFCVKPQAFPSPDELELLRKNMITSG